MNLKYKIGSLFFVAYVICVLIVRPHYLSAANEICLIDGSGNPSGCSLLGDFNSETKRLKADTNGYLLINGLGTAGTTVCEVKKRSIATGATSTTYLNPSAASTAFVFKNESDNTICFSPNSLAITADNSMCLEPYAAAAGENMTIMALSAINTGADSATMSVIFCR